MRSQGSKETGFAPELSGPACEPSTAAERAAIGMPGPLIARPPPPARRPAPVARKKMPAADAVCVCKLRPCVCQVTACLCPAFVCACRVFAVCSRSRSAPQGSGSSSEDERARASALAEEEEEADSDDSLKTDPGWEEAAAAPAALRPGQMRQQYRGLALGGPGTQSMGGIPMSDASYARRGPKAPYVGSGIASRGRCCQSAADETLMKI